MSIIGSNVLAGASGSGVEAYEIEQSLRFNYSEQVLSRTPSANGNKDKFTWSGWVKRTKLGTQVWLFGAGGSSNPREGLNFNNSDQFDVASNTGSSPIYQITSTAKYRDTSAWYHVMYVYDSAQATASNRIKLYINGSQITNLANSTYPSQNGDAQFINGTSQHVIGGLPSNNGLLNAYLAEVIFADGQALSPTDLGEYDNNGVWRPIDPSEITFGTQGYYLKFDPDATNGVGHDHSGNGNNFTATGVTTSGTGTDVMSDTPTNNYAVIQRHETYNASYLSDGNLKVSTPSNSGFAALSSIAMPSTGKYYCEITYTTIAESGIGLRSRPNLNTVDIYYKADGRLTVNGSTTTHATWTTGDVMGVCYDCSTGTLSFNKNGVSTGVSTTNSSDATVCFYGLNYGGDVSVYNFGQQGFQYTPPTGYVALNTANLPAPTIKDGSDYFATDLWTGNDATRDITVADSQGNTWAPDLVWIKMRNSTMSHYLYDTVRGATKSISSDSTRAETTDTGRLTAFNSDGFELGSSSRVNSSPNTYVGWSWLAGGSTSSNTDGSITSTVSVNATAGFSIVSYTGNGTSGATVGHGLGVAASMLIVKNRDRSDSNIRWAVYHRETGNTDVLYLNETNAAAASSAFWNDTTPTSTVFTIGTDNDVNTSGDDYIAYCFAEVEGYSKIGSYEGNGSTDGTFVYCGFRPAWVMSRRSNSTGNWVIQDSARGEYNPDLGWLYANLNSLEDTGSSRYFDFLSNGFKIRNGGTDTNTSGAPYIFIALAENPFGGDGVSPATAR